MSPAATYVIIEIAYIIAAALFILSLKWLSSPTSDSRLADVDGQFDGSRQAVGIASSRPLHLQRTPRPFRCWASRSSSPSCWCSILRKCICNPLIVVIPLIFGVMMIIPIGGADMPTVISLLNSYAGLSAAAMGFVLDSKLLIVAGALDGASGFILSVNMSKAMNRSFTNVLFGAFGQERQARAERKKKPGQCAAPPRKNPQRFWRPPTR